LSGVSFSLSKLDCTGRSVTDTAGVADSNFVATEEDALVSGRGTVGSRCKVAFSKAGVAL